MAEYSNRHKPWSTPWVVGELGRAEYLLDALVQRCKQAGDSSLEVQMAEEWVDKIRTTHATYIGGQVGEPASGTEQQWWRE